MRESSQGSVGMEHLCAGLAQKRVSELLLTLTDTAEELEQLAPYLPSVHRSICIRIFTQLYAMLTSSRTAIGSLIADARQAAPRAPLKPRSSSTSSGPRDESDDESFHAPLAAAQLPRRLAGWGSGRLRLAKRNSGGLGTIVSRADG